MLVLSRKPGEKLIIDHDIVVTVLSVQGNRVRLGINAPGTTRILRGELTDWSQHGEITAVPWDEPISVH